MIKKSKISFVINVKVRKLFFCFSTYFSDKICFKMRRKKRRGRFCCCRTQLQNGYVYGALIWGQQNIMYKFYIQNTFYNKIFSIYICYWLFIVLDGVQNNFPPILCAAPATPALYYHCCIFAFASLHLPLFTFRILLLLTLCSLCMPIVEQ